MCVSLRVSSFLLLESQIYLSTLAFLQSSKISSLISSSESLNCDESPSDTHCPQQPPHQWIDTSIHAASQPEGSVHVSISPMAKQSYSPTTAPISRLVPDAPPQPAQFGLQSYFAPEAGYSAHMSNVPAYVEPVPPSRYSAPVVTPTVAGYQPGYQSIGYNPSSYPSPHIQQLPLWNYASPVYGILLPNWVVTVVLNRLFESLHYFFMLTMLHSSTIM